MSLYPYKFDPKSAAGSDLFHFDWTDWIRTLPGEAIDVGSVTVTAAPLLPSAIVVSEVTLNGYVVRCRLTGGTPKLTYKITCTVTTTPGRRKDSAVATLYIVN